MEVTGKKVLVFGSGISGIGAVKLLEDHGAEVILYDGNDKLDKVAMKEQLGDGVKAEIILGEFPEKLIDTLDIAVLSPGVPTDLPVVNAMRDKKAVSYTHLDVYKRQDGQTSEDDSERHRQ